MGKETVRTIDVKVTIEYFVVKREKCGHCDDGWIDMPVTHSTSVVQSHRCEWCQGTSISTVNVPLIDALRDIGVLFRE